MTYGKARGRRREQGGEQGGSEGSAKKISEEKKLQKPQPSCEMCASEMSEMPKPDNARLGS